MRENQIFFKFTLLILLLFFSLKLNAKDFIIEGNQYSDKEVITGIIGVIPDVDEKSKSNYILKKLNNSGLFKSVEISYDDKNYYLVIVEYPSINNFIYLNNERFKDEQIDEIISELQIYTFSNYNIDRLTDELKKLYQSFGYNDAKFEITSENLINNSSDLYINFKEGEITKIKKINITGNNNFNNNIILSKIKSKTKKLTNIFANNNYKLFQINNDLIRIKRFYKSEGYIDVKIDFYIEYFSDNKVEINFNIIEGTKYYFSTISVNNKLPENNLVSKELESFIINNKNLENINYNLKKIDNLEKQISDILENSGIQFYEIKSFEQTDGNKVNIKFEILPTEVVYINQINISGNTRTFDYVIRRELDVSEGDPINDTKIKQINKKLKQLPIFTKVEVNKTVINNEYQDLNIDIEETQTGTFDVGISVGTLEGISFVSGLKERNINGTGRSLEFLINTSDNNKAFTLSTEEKFVLNNNVNHSYSIKYKENDFSKSKSYKLNTFFLDTSFNYVFSENLYHSIGLGYSLKDYIITDSSTVSTNIINSSGQNISFNINNIISFNTLNSFIRPTKGNYISLGSFIETPSSSTNGFIKNILTAKKYLENNNNIYSIQVRAGNIYSLNDNEIVSDDKFSLGGRWLRGFDNYGAGPRNSRTAYVGGNNLLVTKLDYLKPITLNDQNPIYLNLFNDYGLVWGNKNSVSSSDESIRASYGFGFNYYSPIGPIGFSWGFPLIDKDYDIKRMFTFSIGRLN